MKWLFSFMFTYFEFFSIILLGYALFRYKYKSSVFKIGIMSGIVGLYSTALDYFHIGMIIGLLTQVLLIVLLIRYYAKKKIWTALLMTITAYLLYSFVQAFVVYLYHFFNLMTLDDLQPNSKIAYGVQSLSIFVSISISSMIKLINEGFAINLDKKLKISKLTLTNRFFLILMIIVLSVYTIAINLYLNNLTPIYFFGFFIFCIISSIFMILTCYKRDKEEAGI